MKNQSQPSTGYVYFLLDWASQAIKIGYTSESPEKRKNQLKTGNPNKVCVLKYIPGTKYIESLYHNALHKYITDSGGEWFKLVPNVIQFCQLTDELELYKSSLSTKPVPLVTTIKSKPTYHSELVNSKIEEYNVYKYM